MLASPLLASRTSSDWSRTTTSRALSSTNTSLIKFLRYLMCWRWQTTTCRMAHSIWLRWHSLLECFIDRWHSRLAWLVILTQLAHSLSSYTRRTAQKRRSSTTSLRNSTGLLCSHLLHSRKAAWRLLLILATLSITISWVSAPQTPNAQSKSIRLASSWSKTTRLSLVMYYRASTLHWTSRSKWSL